jgi:hypothetical protein
MPVTRRAQAGCPFRTFGGSGSVKRTAIASDSGSVP